MYVKFWKSSCQNTILFEQTLVIPTSFLLGFHRSTLYIINAKAFFFLSVFFGGVGAVRMATVTILSCICQKKKGAKPKGNSTKEVCIFSPQPPLVAQQVQCPPSRPLRSEILQKGCKTTKLQNSLFDHILSGPKRIQKQGTKAMILLFAGHVDFDYDQKSQVPLFYDAAQIQNETALSGLFKRNGILL